MKRFLVDTNVLVSYLTDRNEEQQRQASQLLEAAARGEHTLLLHQTVLAELVYVLRNLYSVPGEEVADVLRDLLALPGVETVDALSWSHLLGLWPDTYPDFADACLASVAVRAKVEGIATFDQAFARRLRRGGVGSAW